MYFNTLHQIRQQIAGCFERSRDALFNVSDALLSESQARSLPELSLSPFFTRKWSSVYEALQDGRIDVDRLRAVFVETLTSQTFTSDPICLGLDSSSLQRLEADTSPDRGMIYVPNMPHASKPVSAGWQFSTVMLLPEQPSSWVGILDQSRIRSEQTAIEVGLTQLRQVMSVLTRPAMVLADRWYAGARFAQVCEELGCQALVRLKRNRKLYRPAPLRRPGQRGAPAKHGPLWQATRPETLGQADATWEGVDEKGRRLVVSCWKHLHFREAPQTSVCGLRIQREAAQGTRRDPRESWFVWIGSQEVPLDQAYGWYRRRFSQEHGYRFLKQDLLWPRAHLRTPEQVERWSWIVACACNQLLVCRQSGLAVLRPWESRQRDPTPRQLRRIMPGILQQVGTPAQEPKPRGNPPGWPKGRTRTRAPRFEVVRKPKKRPKTPRT
ncbi:MAG TPA: NF041680 family putative transposase [Ktedonobacteraceae bacterium]|nr:NF041680 family putative transposase [Ktedonobacteraceae bacterium]